MRHNKGSQGCRLPQYMRADQGQAFQQQAPQASTPVGPAHRRESEPKYLHEGRGLTKHDLYRNGVRLELGQVRKYCF